jgi:hypothetical protein
MGWRDLHYWLKGSLIGIVIALIPAIYASYSFVIHGIAGGLTGGGASSITENLPGFIIFSFTFWIIFGIALGLIGAIIGLIYEKIKLR